MSEPDKMDVFNAFPCLHMAGKKAFAGGATSAYFCFPVQGDHRAGTRGTMNPE